MTTSTSPQPITLPIHCDHCGHQVTLEVLFDKKAEPKNWDWMCPYHCGRLNRLPGYTGELIDWWPGHGRKPGIH